MYTATHRLFVGQALLVCCCVFYLIWWSISYRPGVSVNRVGGLNGVLLLITALCGISGMVLSISGANSLPAAADRRALSGTAVLIGAVLVYFIMMFVTTRFFHRIVTTELLLITGWGALEILVLDALRAAGVFGRGGFLFMIVVVAAAFAVSMVLYVLYYRMQPGPAFYAAMVPLITEGAAMAILVIMLAVRIRSNA